MPDIETGVLYRGDNIDWLPELPPESVDLIYLDPPFFSNRVYEVIWGDEAEVRSFEDRWEGGIRHYIDWMRQRVTEMRRVLKPSGTFYLHCDPHASHYLKVMLDEVLGETSFRNEVIWKRTGAHGSAKKYAPVHDTILYYAKGQLTWHPQYHEYSPEYLATKYRYEDERGRYRLITLFPPGVRRGASGEPWRGINPTAKGLHWTYPPAKLEELDAQGMIYWGAKGKGLPQLKRYLNLDEGVPVQDVWTDIAPINSQARERLGYPTQKPESLLRRLLTASTNEGDVVLDPFCGCGTTIAVAEQLGREWIGIDISQTAMDVMRWRMDRLTHGQWAHNIVGEVQTIEDLKALKPFEFQNWIIGAMYGDHSPKKSGDMGIDGYSFLTRDPIQVKQSVHPVGRNVVDNFETAMRRGGHDTGYIVGFSFTKDAVEEVQRAKEDGLKIVLLKVAEVLLLKKRAGRPSRKFGPLPPSEDVAPPPDIRKGKERRTVAELVASERAAG